MLSLQFCGRAKKNVPRAVAEVDVNWGILECDTYISALGFCQQRVVPPSGPGPPAAPGAAGLGAGFLEHPGCAVSSVRPSPLSTSPFPLCPHSPATRTRAWGPGPLARGGGSCLLPRFPAASPYSLLTAGFLGPSRPRSHGALHLSLWVLSCDLS